ncbi:hypothetical protein QBC45DRAFT_457020 [Copromyces sp. CBS 386.78]|nr:hypothetical protein QBC45DRAFT_457020 [Copromyces sp. CBS 386.78]
MAQPYPSPCAVILRCERTSLSFLTPSSRSSDLLAIKPHCDTLERLQVTTLDKHLSDIQSTLADANSTLVTANEAFTKLEDHGPQESRPPKRQHTQDYLPVPVDDEDENDIKDPDAFTGEGSTAVKRAEAYRVPGVRRSNSEDSWYYSQDERYNFVYRFLCPVSLGYADGMLKEADKEKWKVEYSTILVRLLARFLRQGPSKHHRKITGQPHSKQKIGETYLKLSKASV